MNDSLTPQDVKSLDLFGSRLMRELDALKEELLSEEEAPARLAAADEESLETASAQFNFVLDSMQAVERKRPSRIKIMAIVSVAAAAVILAAVFLLAAPWKNSPPSKSASASSVDPNPGSSVDDDGNEFPTIFDSGKKAPLQVAIPEPTTASMLPLSLLILLRRKRKKRSRANHQHD